MAGIATTLRVAARAQVRSPIVTGIAVLSLGLGVGSNAAIFSLYSQALLRPLPVAAPERLVNLEAPGPKPGSVSCTAAGDCDAVFSYPMFGDLQRGQNVFSGLAGHRSFAVNVSYRDEVTGGVGLQVSGGYFSTLGISPAAGRLFGPEVDQTTGEHPVAVLSHEFWQSDLGGSEDVIDDSILVNGQSFTIVGIAARGFSGTTVDLRPMIFVPVTMREVLSRGDAGFDDRRNYWIYLFARLKQSTSMEQASAAIAPLYRSILGEMEAPLQVELNGPALERFINKPLLLEDGRRGQSRIDEAVEKPILLLLAITSMVVMIACANIGNLLLARAVARTPEMALRLSLGASRLQLFLQLFSESCLLAALGGVAAGVVAHWTLRFVNALLPADVADVLRLELDPYTTPFIAMLSLLCALVFGLVPALHARRAEVVSSLKADFGQVAGATTVGRFRNALVVTQLALAMTLLVGAGLCIQSLLNASRIDLGIRTDNVVTFTLWPGLDYSESRRWALYEGVERELEALPGVTSVTATGSALFFGGRGTEVGVEGFDFGPETDNYAHFSQITPGYFETLGIQVLAGRVFEQRDSHRAPKVAIVNEEFARKFGLGSDVIGGRLARGGRGADLETEIVGLVSNTRSSYMHSADPALFYVPYRQDEVVGALTFYVRSNVSSDALLRVIPRLVADLDPHLAVTFLENLNRRVWEFNYEYRVGAILSTAFAVIGTILAAVGLYGVLAYVVALRTREFGLRMALGADTNRLRMMMLGQIGGMTAIGTVLGLMAALGLGRVARTVLYGIDGVSLAVLAVAALGLGIVALTAGFVPTYRASRVNPMIALRHQG